MFHAAARSPLMPDAYEEWVRKIQAGDARAMAQAISAVEGRAAGSAELLQRLFLAGREAWVIGVTGAPGVGKSTLAGKLAEAYHREGQRVGVLAVDPSSPFSGGAILGDRIRMPRLARDEGIFIRSMASRGSVGGVAEAAGGAVTVFEAAGCDVVLVETVGAGQDEVDIATVADVTLLVLAPSMGDDVQALKAGVMEIADVFAVNKADLGGADRTEREIAALLSLSPADPAGPAWRPPVVKASAVSGEGVDSVQRTIEEFRSFSTGTPLGAERKRRRWRLRLLQMTRHRLLERIFHRQDVEPLIASSVDRILRREIDPFSAANELAARLSSNSAS